MIEKYTEDDIPNSLPCKNCQEPNHEYKKLHSTAFADDRGSFGYTATDYECPNCGGTNNHYWEMGDWEMGILGKWNGEEIPDEEKPE